MRFILSAAIAMSTLSLAVPASAAQPVLSPCNSVADINPDAVSCHAFSNNLVSGTALTDSAALNYAASVGYSGDGTFAEVLQGLSGQSVIDFLNPLKGINYILIHYGAAGAGAEGTSLYKVDGGSTGISSFTFVRGGLSNAALLGPVGGAVPEPATWALMLFGFGGMGVALRRGRRNQVRLAQIA